MTIKIVIMDVNYKCPTCRKKVSARMTAYSDAIYLTCHSGKHHHTFNSPDEIPGLDTWIKTTLKDEGEAPK